VLGVDVKVPWELSRMQHLPQLALTYLRIEHEMPEREKIKAEFRNQVLDFVATNPPDYGVNWVCTMDVAIRATNIILAYELFKTGLASFDPEFESILVSSIYAHGSHIIHNLEWRNNQRNNHYLADICGLAFIAVALPQTEETNVWLAFSTQELIKEVDYQFYPDGGNFEGSTAYHRLSAEMVYFTTALLLGLNESRKNALINYNFKNLKTGRRKPKLTPSPLKLYSLLGDSKTTIQSSPFKSSYFERLKRMTEFVIDITKQDGHFIQIGDNDSGRFFKLTPVYEPMAVFEARIRFMNLQGYNELPDHANYWMEDSLNASHIVAAASGLFNRPDFVNWLNNRPVLLHNPDTMCIKALSGGIKIHGTSIRQHAETPIQSCKIGSEKDFYTTTAAISSISTEKKRIFNIPISRLDNHDQLILISYPSFGLYLFKSSRLWLAVRCFSNNYPSLCGHFHNDQLAIELIIDGKPIIIDPGTYLYTPAIDIRNRYRSVTAHFTPWPYDNLEPAPFDQGVFQLYGLSKANVTYFGPDGFAGNWSHNGKNILRRIALQQNLIQIIDKADMPYPHLSDSDESDIQISVGYGVMNSGNLFAGTNIGN
jgi:hypothetical protein